MKMLNVLIPVYNYSKNNQWINEALNSDTFVQLKKGVHDKEGGF